MLSAKRENYTRGLSSDNLRQKCSLRIQGSREIIEYTKISEGVMKLIALNKKNTNHSTVQTLHTNLSVSWFNCVLPVTDEQFKKTMRLGTFLFIYFF